MLGSETEVAYKKAPKSNLFNTCPYQPLQVMTRRPLDMTFTREAKPSAVHIPIPVPHHWKKRMKEDLDWHVALGIIKLVPAGTLRIWCSYQRRMGHSGEQWTNKNWIPHRWGRPVTLHPHLTKYPLYLPEPKSSRCRK